MIKPTLVLMLQSKWMRTYHIAGKFGDLADLQAYRQIKIYKINMIMTLHVTYARPCCTVHQILLVPVEANPPNLIPAEFLAIRYL